MIIKRNNYIILIGIIIFLSNCASEHEYNFTCDNTLSIFINKENNTYRFNIPIQYIGNYQLETFDLLPSNILIGDYNIILNRENTTIAALLNTASDEYGKIIKGSFDLVYLEEYGIISTSELNAPITKSETDNTLNQYNINIQRILTDDEAKSIINEYRKGNINSSFIIWYKATIDNEFGEFGISDDFILNNEHF